MSLYVHRPSVTDPSAAPEGDDTFYALSPVPHLGHGAADWGRFADSYKTRVADMLEPLLPGFRDRLTAERVFTPETFRDRYHSPYRRRLFASSHASCNRPGSARTTCPRNCRASIWPGAGTHPGAGVPGVIGTAEVLDQLIPGPRRCAPKPRCTPGTLRMAAE
jgi:phytoene desaturase